MDNTEHMDSVHRQMDMINQLLLRLMWSQLHSLGCLDRNFTLNDGTKPFYHKWLEVSLQMLHDQQELLPVFINDLSTREETAPSFKNQVWNEWESQLNHWLSHPDLKAHVLLVDKMLRNLPDILEGRKQATELMFPESSMELVEGIYKHNVMADFFNEVLAHEVVTYVQKQSASTAGLRILEIGAGTGGTSAVVFHHLQPFQELIQEYCYSDISKAFLMHAEQKYGPHVPYLTYKIADLRQPLSEQGIDTGAYDLMIASNVLHTTNNIRKTLRTVKAAMKKNGLLLLNEITDKTVINHLTFGLLEGWWQYEDTTVRVWGSPALSTKSWKKVLKREGFHSVTYPASAAAPYKQQVIVAKSDGIVIQTQSSDKSPKAPKLGQQEFTNKRSLVKHSESRSSKEPAQLAVTEQMVKEFVKTAIRESIAEDLKIKEDRIQNNRSFSEYGIDSIIAVHLVNLINKRCGLTLQTTVLFDYNNVDQLVSHIVLEHYSTIQTLLQKGTSNESNKTSNEALETSFDITPHVAVEPFLQGKPDLPTSSTPKQVTALFTNVQAREQDQSHSFPSSGLCFKAVINGPSAIEDVAIQQMETPPLREDEVRIAVRAFSLNFGDLLSVKGLYPTMPPYPFTPGFEAAGVVVETGSAVTSVHCGDEVIFYASENMGAHATAITCHSSNVFPKPQELSFEEASSLPVVAMTAIAAFRKAQIKKGESILIQTATGGIGLLAVQLAKHYGAVIYATASTQTKLDFLQQIGADYVINYMENDFQQEIRRLTEGRGIDIILNTLGGDALQKGLNCLSRGGRYIEIAMTALKSAKTVDLSGLNHNQSFYSMDLRKLGFEDPEMLRDYRNEMLRLIEEGVIRPHIGKVFPINLMQEAYRYMERRENIGKIVVTIPEPYRYQQAGATPHLSATPHVQSINREAVAIIGMSGRFAKSDHVDELWGHLENGTDLIQEVTRWNLSKHFPDGSSYCNFGSFLDDISTFDPLFFNISGQEASYMDPQQRIFLEEAWRALEDAGYAGASMQGRRCGIYVGCTEMDYQNLTGDNPPPQSFWGKAASIIPARIAYYLDLHGPAIAVDTACSSSLVAIHLACQGLWSKETEMALAGGVFIQSTPQFYIDSNRAGMLSHKGRCHTFDDRADGFVPGEGAGVIVLKRLKDAIADGDHIYGVIRGSGMNQDGTTNGITAPSAKSQTRLEQEVYDTFQIDPADIQMVEAHGTGTKLGDPIEFQALTKAFSLYTDKKGYCAIGSIKTNIGHLATAAGIAGVIKILLSLKNKRIPASLHMKNGNPSISFADSPFYVNTTTKDWSVPNGKSRLGAISSFGFSGTNVHVVIEEAPQPQPSIRKHEPKPGYLIALSARTEEQLRQQAAQLVEHCARQPVDCENMSFTLLTGRQHNSHRLACVVRNQEELVERLNRWLEKGKAPQLYISVVNRNEQREQTALKRYAEECIRKCRRAVQATDYLENLTAVAELFIQGYELHFDELFAEGTCRRISLPTYPFRRESFWVPLSESDEDRQTRLRGGQTTHLHPLMHTNASDLSEQRYSSFFSGEEFFLAEHLVRGEKVLPGVAHLEWARAAVEHASGGMDSAHMIQLKNIVWATPLTMKDTNLHVHIGVYPQENGELTFEIYRDMDKEGQRLIYSQGTAIIRERDQSPQVNIDAALTNCSPSQVTADAFYDITKITGIDLGNSLRGIKTVFTGSGEVLAKLSLPSIVSSTEAKFVLHPSMMDSALQVTIGYLVGTVTNQTEARKPVIPFTLDNLEIYRPCTASMWVIARFHEGSSAHEKVFKLHVDLCDEDGNVCARMTGFSPRVLEGGISPTSGAEGKAVILIPEWVEKPIVKKAAEADYKHNLIILSEPFVHWADKIRTNLSETNCIVLRPDAQITQRYLSASTQLLEEIQHVIRSRTEGKVLIQVVVQNHGEDSLLSGLSGLLQTAGQEHTWLIGQLIETEVSDDGSEIIAKLTENRHRPLDRLIRYANGTRYVREWREEMVSESSKSPWKDKGIYLITGGLRGLGYIFAQEMVRQVKNATIILNGRSPLHDQEQTKLKALEINSNNIHYRTVDISDKYAVTLFIRQIQSEFGSLNGIIHAAGIIKDQYIRQKASEEMLEVLAPKVNGTVYLDEASAAMNLDFFIMFSSLAGVIGNTGQGDYAAANAFLDGFARYRNELVAASKRNGSTLSLDWSLWKEGGMSVSEAEKQMIKQQLGMLPLETAWGVKMLNHAMHFGYHQVIGYQGHVARLRAKLMPESSLSPEESSIGENQQLTPVLPSNSNSLSDKVQEALARILSQTLKVNSSDIYPDVEFGEYGFDSISFTEFANRLNEQYKLGVTPTIFFEYSTLRALAQHLSVTFVQELNRVFSVPTIKPLVTTENHSIQQLETKAGRSRFSHLQVATSEVQTHASNEPIAIIGMSGAFPMAQDVNKLWANLVDGRDCISEIPEDRWDWKEYFGDPNQEGNKTNIKWGGFIDGVADFDPMFFGISPHEATLMDPQQRLLMMHVWKAIEDAGYSPHSLSGSKMGIFVGTASSGYNGLLSQANSAIEGYSSTGHVSSVGPNRMSFFLNVNGPSEPIETACSSSLVALHRAVQAIRNGDCDTAVVGGVNTILDPYYHISFNKAGMLSEDGRCKTFSDRVNGYVRGEGVGMIFLKKLADAENAGDHIYGLVRSTDENHGGRATSLTAPNPRAQADLIKSVLTKAQIDPTTITYIEAHGTGTPLGDPIEINGLKTAFRELGFDAGGQPSASCGLGSIKTNIGHLELAAGIAGVIKVLLQLKYKTLVKTVHFENLNPYIQLENSPFYIVDETKEWTALRDTQGREMPRRAGISSFGFGGVNAHVLIEEYIPKTVRRDEWIATPDHPVLIVLSARTEEQLLEQARQLLDTLQTQSYKDEKLDSIAYTLQVGRTGMEERLGMTAASIHELKEKLARYIQKLHGIEDVYRGQVKRNKESLSSLVQDEDMQETVQRWMQKKKFAKLLELWVKGLDVDWSGLYTERKPQRLNLPTYPFAKDRYWMPQSRQSPRGGTVQPHTVFLHPLLHQNTSNLSEQRFTSIFNGNEFFLADHVIRGRKVLPGVAYLEMARSAVEQAAELDTQDHVTVKLQNVIWASSIVVDEEPVQVHIKLVPEVGKALHYEIYSKEAQGNGQPVLYNQGEVVILEQCESGKLDLAALLPACNQGILSSAECYQAFEKAGLHYGMSHQGIQAIHLGHNQVLAQLTLPSVVSATAQDFVLHPSVLDSAIQACLGLHAFERKAGTPFSVDEVAIYRSCTRTMWAWVRYSRETHYEKSMDKLDIDLCDEQGNHCVQIKGLAIIRTQEGGSGKGEREESQADSEAVPSALQQVGGGLLLHPVWDVVHHDGRVLIPAPKDNIVFIGGTNEPFSSVRKLYPNVCSIEFEASMQMEDMKAVLSQHDSIDHLIWVAPFTSYEAMVGEQTMKQQELGLLQLFRLSKALMQLGYDTKELGITIITTRTLLIQHTDPIQSTHAGIQGFAGTLTKEMPNWSIRHIDVEDPLDLPIHELFLLPADRDGNTWAYRQQEWYQQKWITVHQPQQQIKSYRYGGVYVVIGGAGGIGEVWSEYMIRTYDAQMIWIGRRDLDHDIAAKLDKLAAIGRAPLYLSADASDYVSLQQAFLAIKQTYPTINGVIHSAVGVMDQSLTQMTEERFRAGLSAKVDVSIHMTQIFAKEALDFMMYFSSMSSFTKPIGQSGYAAGCSFADAFAHETGQVLPFPIKVMNWGYWGEIGIAGIVPAAFKKRLTQSGIGFIEPEEAMQALETLVGNSLSQMAFIRTTRPDAIAEVHQNEMLVAVPNVQHVSTEKLQKRLPDHSSLVQQLKRNGSHFDQELDRLLLPILGKTLQTHGLMQDDEGVHDAYKRWLAESKAILARHDWKDNPDLSIESLWGEWEEQRKSWLQDQNVKAQVKLIDTMLRHLPDILTGKIPATDIMFPNSSMQLVEDVYKHHAVADYFNGVLADTVVAYVEERLQQNPSVMLRILEVGAGTGGTSSLILQKLKPYANYIAEYAYTDLSKAFLLHGAENYGAENPYVICKMFDVEKSPEEQSFDLGGYDLVIAANVLHATRNIRRTLRHVKALLKENGMLFVNELTRSTLFAHLTFGLLEGWWLYEDERVRIPGSPALNAEQWQIVLAQAGFETVWYPAASAMSLGQQIMIARSDGIVHLPNRSFTEGTQEISNKQQTVVAQMETRQSKQAEPSVDEEELRKRASLYFRQLVGEVVRLPFEQIDESEPLEAYGIDSILIVQLTNRLRKHFSDVSSTLFFEYQTLSALIGYFMLQRKGELVAFLGLEKAKPTTDEILMQKPLQPGVERNDVLVRTVRPRVLQTSQRPVPRAGAASVQEPIAVIGMSGRYPQAINLEHYWDHLEKGKDCITEIPEDRWLLANFYVPDRKKAIAQGKSYSKWGGFLDGFAQFDPLFFNLSPREAMNMDPQERLFLQTVWEALEDAGYTREQLDLQFKGKVGVFAGITKTGFNLYGPALWRQGSEWFPLTSFSSVANRVSYWLNLHGPSMPVDTMCSSSLTAIHQACESLRSGACEAAIVGGVNLYLHPSNYVGLCAQNMLASDGACKSFGQDADGFVPGEGVGVLILKPLSKAIQDQDHIHAIIRGTGINHGGKTNGYLVPNPVAQAELIRETMDKAGVHARSISYMEAHGTGTSLGDPIEVAGLTTAFQKDTSDVGYCAIGSVKSNIGHLESAAGIASLTKVILQMKHGKIVPSLHARKLNSEIHFDKTPFVVQQNLTEWKRPILEIDGVEREVPRIAGISSFGAGGANAHIIVEEYVSLPVGAVAVQQVIPQQPAVIVLSARNKERLLARAKQLLSFIDGLQVREDQLADLAYTLQIGREAMEERLAFTAASMNELAGKLATFIQKGGQQCSVDNIFIGQVKRSSHASARLEILENTHQTMQTWPAQQQYPKLLDMWVKGMQINWNEIYGTHRPRKISLPVYPFAEETYWLPSANDKPPISYAMQNKYGPLHPLLHQNTADLTEQRFTSIFTGQEFFLADHLIKGQKILPGVAHLEMAREALNQAAVNQTAEHTVISLRNIVWASPVRVENDEATVHIRLYENERNGIKYEIFTGDTKHDGIADTTVIHSQGSAFLQKTNGQPMIDLAAIRTSCTRELSVESCYQTFAEMGLEYGTSMQSIEKIYAGEDQVIAKLYLPTDKQETMSQFVLHPSLMDAALQSSIGLMPSVQSNSSPMDKPLLPYALERMDVLHSCVPHMWAYIRYSENGSPGDPVQKLDIDVCDEEGRVCVQLTGFTSKVLKAGILVEDADDAVETLLLAPVWHEQVEEAVSQPVFHTHIVLLCEPWTSLSEHISTEMSTATCLILNLEEHQRTPNASGIGEDFLFAVYQAFRHVQHLLKEKPMEPTLIQLLTSGQSHNRLYSALSGLLKTAELENPQLRVQIIETEPEEGISHVIRKLLDSASRPEDTHIRFHQGRTYKKVWKELRKAGYSGTIWKDQGVYLITGGMSGLGFVTAQHIARSVNHPTLIVTGRSPMNPTHEEQLSQLAAMGAKVIYKQSDVSHLGDVTNLMHEIRQRFGRLNGIIHSAGMIRDSFLIRKQLNDVQQVLASKVAGTIYLDEASKDFTLDFFVLYSSLAGTLGNIGQADYATANAFMDEFARYRNEQTLTKDRYGHTLSISWPLWEGGGMSMDEQTRSRMKQLSGMIPLQRETGMKALHHALVQKESHVVCMYGNAEKMRNFMEASNEASYAASTQTSEPEAILRELVEKIRNGECTLEQFTDPEELAKLL
ncbi:SDR family NAD(P)-dependent oxidoreductase [Brevibacillus sp. NPDC003359]|uniref:SDR family NAD(P)-dependent oxidoreductase n=1 Tax=unclassified Brevibacillus TaxID=2684853 RepID=UPI00368756E0